MNFDSDITQVKGIGDKSSEGFRKLGINTVRDLLMYYPRTYEKFENIVPIKDIVAGERNAVLGMVASNPKLVKLGSKTMLTVYIKDRAGDMLEIKYFNMQFLAKTLKKDKLAVFRGYARQVGNRLMMSQPKMYSPDEYSKIEGTIGPIYSVTKDITSGKIQKSVAQSLPLLKYTEDFLTDEEIETNKLYPLSKAQEAIHVPKDENELFLARRRLVFEEFLSFYHMIRSGETGEKKPVDPNPFIEVSECGRFKDALPFKLTGAQEKTIREIFDDMCSGFMMNRLIQGDVGSGKTIVAIFALLLCAANGCQGALMAPTEVLAVQHYENIKSMSEKYKLCIKPVLLTGKMTKKAREAALSELSSGEANVCIGTHALFQESVVFNKLKLVITDEQHRFGVNQREEFSKKGINPHILVMSATPIPRTLALIVYGHVDISVMDELPKNRLPINNCVVNSSYRQKTLSFIEKQIEMGHQAYVICPMIDESEEDNFNLKSVGDEAEELKEYFGEKANIGILHGKMKSDEKNRIMGQFKEGNIDILVSTTVIEVGVDVPNATVIMIENAERFGLSQLHQLRGRVGRGNAQSYCILMSDAKSETSVNRLKVLNETNDGFEIAKRDMQQRGPGDLSGVRQSGELDFGLGDIMEDSDLILLVSEIYDSIGNRLSNRDVRLIDFRTI